MGHLAGELEMKDILMLVGDVVNVDNLRMRQSVCYDRVGEYKG